jgi:hypothetical protein
MSSQTGLNTINRNQAESLKQARVDNPQTAWESRTVILNFCGACGEKDVTKLENHHLVPRSAGGSDDPTNLITLCHVCHGKAHGYQRLNVRVLSAAGVTKAKANGKRSGNPGLRNGDPAAIRKIAEARDAMYLGHLKSTADTWLPIVQRMRPKHRWELVVSAIKAETGQDWSVAKLRRAVGRLVSDGLAEPALLEPAPRSLDPALRSLDPNTRLPMKASEVIHIIAELVRKTPSITVLELSKTLRAMKVRKPEGNIQWGEYSTKKYLKRARALGLLSEGSFSDVSFSDDN